MKKEVKIIIIIGIVLLVLLTTIGTILFYINKDKNPNEVTDAIKFKEEYESLNNVEISEGVSYRAINISDDNPVKYVDVKEAIDIIKNKSGIIYFGANWCPWCRNAIPVLFDVASENGLDTVYYLDMTDVRNSWEVKEGKLVKTQEEQEGYYELLELMDDVLGKETYKLTSDEIEYDTKEKRIYLPMVIAVKDGNIIGNHVGTVTLNDGQSVHDALDDNQIEELSSIYEKLVNDVKVSNVCTSNELCD